MPDPDVQPSAAPPYPTEEPASARSALEPRLAVEPARHDPYAALRSSNYRHFAVGHLASSFGLQMFATALGWEVYERTNSALALGLIGLFRALPVIATALPAGAIIDAFDRRKVLILTQAALGLILAALAAASLLHAPLWATYALLVLMGCARAPNGPARASLLPSIVPVGVFHNAVTWNSTVFQTAAMVGPIAAGALIAWLGAAWHVYALAAAGCFAFAVSGLFIRPRPVAPPAPPGGPSRFTFASMLDGLSHVRNEKTILAAITLDLFAVLLGGATALLPMYAEDILHAGPFGLGLLRAAPFIGALLMALVLAHQPPFRRAGPALLWSVAAYGLATLLFAYSTNLWLSIALLALSGAADNVSVVVRHVLVQMRTPERIRGRVSAVNAVFIESSNELGGFRAGVVARWLGPVDSVALGGVGTALVVLGVAAAWPEIRRLGRLHETEEAAG